MKDPEFKSKSDEELVEIIRTHNKEVYSYLVRRYQDKLIRYAEYLTSDSDLASDVVQQSLIKAYINLNGFDIKKNFSSWIYRIVHNESINLIGKENKTLLIDPDMDFDSEVYTEDLYLKQELISNTKECLEKMSVIYREPLSLYYLEDKSYVEISDILRLPTGTVSVRIKRAKNILKKLCQKITK